MLKLSEVLHVKQVPLKKAAGGELIVWDDADQKPAPKKSQEKEDAKVLAFPKKTINELIPMQDEAPKEDEGGPSSLLTSDVILWQRELTKQSGETSHKMDAFKGYKKSTEMYVVKTPTNEGKDKIRFASTNGVLVNKKQA